MRIQQRLLLLLFLGISFAGGLQAQQRNAAWAEKFNAAIQLYSHQQFRPALSGFEAAIAIEPNDTTAYIYAASCALKVRDANKLNKYISLAEYLGWKSPRKYELLAASARLIAREPLKSLDILREGEAIYPGRKDLMLERAFSLIELKQYDAALDCLHEMMQRFPSQQEAYDMASVVESRRKGDFPQALKTAEAAQKAFPDSVQYYKLETDFLIKMERLDDAEQRLQQDIMRFPREASFRYNLGLIYYAKNDYANALKQTAVSLELDGNFYDALFNLGIYYYHYGVQYANALSAMGIEQYIAQGEVFSDSARQYLQKATPYFEKAIVLNPSDLDAYAALNTIKVMLGDIDENLAFLAEYRRQQGASTTPSIVMSSLRMDYGINATELNKGNTGNIRLTVRNAGNEALSGMKVILFQPVSTPGLQYPSSVDVNSIPPGDSLQVSIPVTFLANDYNTRGVERFADTKNKMHVAIQTSSGTRTEGSELLLNLAENIAAKSMFVSATEDFYFDVADIPVNYLLVIGINNYTSWRKLSNAVPDARAVCAMLSDKYRFSKENIFELYDQAATHENIRNELIKIKSQMGDKDNLIIYYSGHGSYDPVNDVGAWIPVNAVYGQNTDYLQTSVLLDYLSKLSARHIVLVSDACFSGTLFESANISYVENDDNKRSRWGFTSGNVETVADGKPGEHSPFNKALLEILSENKSFALPISRVISYVKFKVENEANQTPIGRPLKMEGNEGGEYLFYMK